MKKLAGILLILTLIFISCKEEEILPPGSPSGLVLSATGDGVQVRLEWEAPTATSPEGYIIYFKPIGSTSYTVLDTVVETFYVHDPNGETGDYYVTAYTEAGGESGSSETQSTVPIHTDVTSVYELNVPDERSSYGWDRVSGTGSTYFMADAASIPYADFYITDWAMGYAGATYNIASPDEALGDDGNTGFVPTGNWRKNGVLEISTTQANSILPPEGDYYNYEEIVGNAYYGIHTEDDHYGVVRVVGSPNTSDGSVQVETWFQLIPGLRLVKHSAD